MVKFIDINFCLISVSVENTVMWPWVKCPLDVFSSLLNCVVAREVRPTSQHCDFRINKYIYDYFATLQLDLSVHTNMFLPFTILCSCHSVTCLLSCLSVCEYCMHLNFNITLIRKNMLKLHFNRKFFLNISKYTVHFMENRK